MDKDQWEFGKPLPATADSLFTQLDDIRERWRKQRNDEQAAAISRMFRRSKALHAAHVRRTL